MTTQRPAQPQQYTGQIMPVWAPLRQSDVSEKDTISTDSKFNPDLCSLDQLVGHATVAKVFTKYSRQKLSLSLCYTSAGNSSIGGISPGSSKVRSYQWPAYQAIQQQCNLDRTQLYPAQRGATLSAKA
jgi:hypothetical protein